MFKAEPSRNIGRVIFLLSQVQRMMRQLRKKLQLFAGGTDASGGTENFQNTKNDSMFVMANSDMPFNNKYVSPNQLPQTIQAQIATVAVGQTFGPYKEQNFM
jgi:peptidyl-prolyl cis-trans isomerase D